MIVRIADEIMDFTPAHVDFFERRMKEYIVDESEVIADVGAIDVKMVSRFVSEVIADSDDEIRSIASDTGMQSKLYRVSDEVNEIVNYSKQGNAISKIKYKKDYTDIEICINERFRPTYVSLCDYEYMLTGSWFAYFLSKKNGMMFHSSAMMYGDDGLLFSGNPGAGKSTHVSLWEKYYGEAVTVINDDKPIVKFIDDKAFVYGTPWSGKTEKNTNAKVELSKIFFVVKAKENVVREMTRKEAVISLFGQVLKPYHDAGMIEHNLDLIDRIVCEKGVYELKCDISRDAVEAVKTIV